MGMLAIKPKETTVYNTYKHNVIVLSSTITITSGCIGDYVSVDIIDNNKKHFKKCRLCNEFFPMADTEELEHNVNTLVYDYIYRKIGRKIKREINNRLVEDLLRVRHYKQILDEVRERDKNAK